MQRLVHFLVKYVLSRPGVLYNILYTALALVYAVSLRPVISSAVGNPVDTPRTAPGLAILILAALILESLALFHKIKKNPSSKSGNNLMIIVICLHWVMVTYAAYYAFRAFGLKGDWNSPLLALFVAPVFLKEMQMLFAYVQHQPKKKKAKTNRTMEAFHTFCLFFSGLVFSTVIWDTQLKIFGSLSDPAGGILLPAGKFASALIACLIMFVPTRLGFLFDERDLDSPGGKKIILITLGMAVIAGMAPLILA